MIALRAKKVKRGYSLYLDYNRSISVLQEDGTVKLKRKFEFLKLHVSKDYTNPDNKNILEHDKSTWKQAMAMLRQRQLEDLQNPAINPIDFEQNVDFLQFIEKIVLEKNHTTYTAMLAKLQDFLSERTVKIKSVDKQLLYTFLQYLEAQDFEKSTAHAYFNRLKICWKVGLDRGDIKHDPFKGIKASEQPNDKIIYLEIPEIKAFAEAQTEFKVTQDAFIFSCYTGLRISDIYALKGKHIVGNRLEIVMQKTDTLITMELAEQAKKILAKYHLETEKPVFNLASETALRKHIKAIAESVGITKDISYHTSRHSFATMLLTLGVAVTTVQKLMGHKDIKTTQKYAHVIDAVKNSAIALLPTF